MIGAGEGGARLDRLLSDCFPSSSRAFCRDALAAGDVLLNGRPGFKGAKVRPGDEVRIARLLERRDNRIRPDPSVRPRILYEDAALVAADKPAGIPVQPLSCAETGALMNGLAALYPELAEVGDQPLMGGALHRIDAGTSGLVLAARTPAAFRAMRAQFAARRVEKVYWAAVEGAVRSPGVLTHELAHLPGAPFCKMVDARSASPRPRRVFRAVTAYRPLGRFPGGTLLEVAIRTGVTHQIRAQLSLAGMPVLNDALYGARPLPGARRHFLHALAAAFTHPLTGRPCRIETPPPPDFPPLSPEETP